MPNLQFAYYAFKIGVIFILETSLGPRKTN